MQADPADETRESTRSIACPPRLSAPLLANAARGLWSRYRSAPRLLFWGWAAALSAYLTLLHFTFGLHPSLLIGSAAMLFLCLWNRWTQRLAAGATPFLAQGVIYELTRFTRPLLHTRHVHIAEPYTFDRTWFGVRTAVGVLTPNELFQRHHWPWVDLVTGIPYILYIYEVLAFLIFLSFTQTKPGRRELLHRFGAAFFVMCVMGYAIYFLYPAAPPWYVATHGFGPPDFSVNGSAASALRWDRITGIPYFHYLYRLTSDVFGAIPSLHVAFALIVALYVPSLRKPWLTLTMALLYLLMCFSAVYLQHHYVIDVIAGSGLALGVFIMERAITATIARSRRPPALQPVAIVRTLPVLPHDACAGTDRTGWLRRVATPQLREAPRRARTWPDRTRRTRPIDAPAAPRPP
jgi:membrane-associated phospholipid phosphatase